MRSQQQSAATIVGAPPLPAAPPLRFPLVTQNGFRAFGVPANASRRELLAADGSFRRALKLDMAKPTDWDLPWLGGVDRTEATLQNATGRLADVERRLIDRLFWFGPDAQDLVKLSPEAARALSSTTGNPDSDHDAALLMLLHLAYTDSLFADTGRWQASITAWISAVSKDDYWTLLLDRDRDGDFEPAANDDDLSAVRHRANQLALAAIAEAGKAQAAAGNEAVVSRIVQLVRNTPLENELRYGLENEIIGPIEEEIIRLCREISTGCRSKIVHENAAAEKNQPICTTTTPRLDAELLPRLAKLERIAGKDSMFARRARGEIALAFAEIAACWTWADNFMKSEELYKRAHAFAGGTPAEGRIKEAVEKVKNPAHLQRDKFKPIKNVPPLRTVNGIGISLYSLGIAYPPKPEWRYATLYFVVLFIPLIPLKRYLVTPGGGNSWYFHATIRFGAVQWIHLGFIVVFGLTSLLSLH
jgi:hypothetical protein